MSTADAFFYFCISLKKILYIPFVFERYFLGQNSRLIVVFVFVVLTNFNTLKILLHSFCFHCFLVFIPLYEDFFPSGCFKIFTLSLVLSKLLMMYLSVFFFVSCACISLNFLGMQFYNFHQICNMFGYYFFISFLSPFPPTLHELKTPISDHFKFYYNSLIFSSF